MQLPDRGRKLFHITELLLYSLLRNVAPRQGTETCQLAYPPCRPPPIEKCSSPIGDGNLHCNHHDIFIMIEKCSSPIGDGNRISNILNSIISLRNVAPRQGTETFILLSSVLRLPLRNVAPRQGTETRNPRDERNDSKIEKCSSPIGDGNF